MFGTVDIFMALKNKVTDEEKNNANKFFKYNLDRGSNLTWICFLPRRTDLNTAQKYNLLPKKDNIIAYEVPLNLIADHPSVTKKAFYSLVEDFERMYEEDELHKKDIAFLGLSVGSLVAFFLANKYQSTKLCAICPTGKLGAGIFEAFAARKIKKEAIRKGFNAISYDTVLGEINPIYNISNLPKDIKIVISRFDNYVPYRGGIELLNKIQEIKKNVKIYKFSSIGHFLTMIKIGWLNKRYDFFE